MEELTPMLEKLAEKLGTTTEYLWGVLLKQAPITAVTELVYLILVVLCGITLYKIHKRLSKKVDGNNSIYYESEELVIVPMVIATIIWAILFIICFLSIGSIVTGFLNPEYWALDEIMSLIK